MPGARLLLLALIGVSGSGCTFLLSFSEEIETDASPADARAQPDTLTRPADAGADAAPPDAALPPDAAPCVEGVSRVLGDDGHCYLLFDDATTWEAARAACEALGPTAHLVTLTSAAENALIAPLLGAAHRWTGFTDVTTEGSWLWYTGEAVSYTNWRTGEPNNGGTTGEDCGVIEGNTGALWDDRPCELAYGRICERE